MAQGRPIQAMPLPHIILLIAQHYYRNILPYTSKRPTISIEPDDYLVELVVRLDSLRLARVKHHCWILRIAVPGDLISSLRLNGGSRARKYQYKSSEAERCRNVLLALDVENLALRVSTAPVPADSVSWLGTFLGLRSRVTSVVVVVFFFVTLFLGFVLL